MGSGRCAFRATVDATVRHPRITKSFFILYYYNNFCCISSLSRFRALDAKRCILTSRLAEALFMHFDATSISPEKGLRCAAATQQVPTGFSSLPPPGPAMPVVATLQSVSSKMATPRAMASAHSRLTAPCCSRTSSGTFKRFILTSLA